MHVLAASRGRVQVDDPVDLRRREVEAARRDVRGEEHGGAVPAELLRRRLASIPCRGARAAADPPSETAPPRPHLVAREGLRVELARRAGRDEDQRLLPRLAQHGAGAAGRSFSVTIACACDSVAGVAMRLSCASSSFAASTVAKPAWRCVWARSLSWAVTVAVTRTLDGRLRRAVRELLHDVADLRPEAQIQESIDLVQHDPRWPFVG